MVPDNDAAVLLTRFDNAESAITITVVLVCLLFSVFFLSLSLMSSLVQGYTN